MRLDNYEHEMTEHS